MAVSRLPRSQSRTDSNPVRRSAGSLIENLETRRLLSGTRLPTSSAPAGPVIIDHVGESVDGMDPQYQLFNRWTTTASGGTGSTGNGMTLTYSIVPDGTTLYTGSASIGEA